MTTPAYEFRHSIPFAETNVVGNVYFAHFVAWQGACREMFLRDHAPDILEELARDLSLVTLNVNCEYLGELHAFDEVVLHMRLLRQTQNRVLMGFDYVLQEADGERLVARGRQEIACMRRTPAGLVPIQIPERFAQALAAFQEP